MWLPAISYIYIYCFFFKIFWWYLNLLVCRETFEFAVGSSVCWARSWNCVVSSVCWAHSWNCVVGVIWKFAAIWVMDMLHKLQIFCRLRLLGPDVHKNSLLKSAVFAVYLFIYSFFSFGSDLFGLLPCFLFFSVKFIAEIWQAFWIVLSMPISGSLLTLCSRHQKKNMLNFRF